MSLVDHPGHFDAPRRGEISMSADEEIRGRHVTLRPATPDDERAILEWLFRSDLAPTMLGPPLYPERPIPPPEEPGEGCEPYYFDGSAPEPGRCFLIVADGEPVGQVNSNDIHERGGRRRTELDIGMRCEACCGKGYGTDALNALCRSLHERSGVVEFMVQPSAHNPRAIRAYEKAGFRRLDLPIEEARSLWGPSDYADSVYMVRAFPPEGGGEGRP
jgi:diamine N-acetyltransferase